MGGLQGARYSNLSAGRTDHEGQQPIEREHDGGIDLVDSRAAAITPNSHDLVDHHL